MDPGSLIMLSSWLKIDPPSMAPTNTLNTSQTKKRAAMRRSTAENEGQRPSARTHLHSHNYGLMKSQSAKFAPKLVRRDVHWGRNLITKALCCHTFGPKQQKRNGLALSLARCLLLSRACRSAMLRGVTAMLSTFLPFVLSCIPTLPRKGNKSTCRQQCCSS